MTTDNHKQIIFQFVVVFLGLLVCSVILYEINTRNSVPQITYVDMYSYDVGYNDGLVDALDKVQSCEMRFSRYNVSTENGIYGVYSHPDYFCVWTKDREPRDIAQTTFHELAHYYAYRDSKHFCGGDYITKKVCEEDI